MRTARLKLPFPGLFHCINRTVNREFLFEDKEKEHFIWLMRRVEAFTGCTVITFVVMGNHFHILLAENESEVLDDEALLARMEALYGADNTTFKEDKAKLLKFRADDSHAAAEALRQRYLRRMNNCSEFMRTLNQRFAQWINKTQERTGHLWQQRYKRVLVEPGSEALSAMACYIDMNPVRAGIVDDPKKYPWSGYGQAVAGVHTARQGFVRLYNADSRLALGSGPGGATCWEDVAQRYRMLIYETGVQKDDGYGNTLRPGFSAKEIQDVLASGGRLSFGQLMRCRVSYFSSCVVLGSFKFVADLEPNFRKAMGLKFERKPGEIEEADIGFHVFRRRSGKVRACD